MLTQKLLYICFKDHKSFISFTNQCHGRFRLGMRNSIIALSAFLNFPLNLIKIKILRQKNISSANGNACARYQGCQKNAISELFLNNDTHASKSPKFGIEFFLFPRLQMVKIANLFIDHRRWLERCLLIRRDHIKKRLV